MLIKESKEVLNYLRACHYETDVKNVPDNIDEIFSPTASSETNEILDYLADNGYIKLARYNDGTNNISLTHKGLHYEQFEQPVAPTQTFNFNAPVKNSAVGNAGSIIINNGITFQEAISFIQEQNISQYDKTEATKIVEYIQTLSEADSPIKKGALSKFGDILNRFHWLPELVMKLLFVYFTGIQV